VVGEGSSSEVSRTDRSQRLVQFELAVADTLEQCSLTHWDSGLDWGELRLVPNTTDA
jgi:hypothetical protein